MSTFEIHTIDSAPANSAPALRALEQGLGFVPNLAATMAESPALVRGFVDLRGTLAAGELTDAPLDAAFEPQAWARAAA